MIHLKGLKSLCVYDPSTNKTKIDQMFELILYVPVNSNGHVGTLSLSVYGTFTQH